MIDAYLAGEALTQSGSASSTTFAVADPDHADFGKSWPQVIERDLSATTREGLRWLDELDWALDTIQSAARGGGEAASALPAAAAQCERFRIEFEGLT
jgi:hypothetical protein